MRILLVLVLALFGATCVALEMPVYEGEVEVPAGTTEATPQALRGALAAVLVKLSGDRRVAQDGEFGRIAAQAEAASVTTAIRTTESGRTVLIANFAPDAVHGMLAALGRPLWRSDRPALLVWLGIDDGNSKQIAHAGQIAALGAMTGTARARALPLLFPRMDGVDQNRINATTLWSAPAQNIIAASQRYGVQTTLVVRLSLGQPWRARYTLIDGLAVEEWSAEANDSQVLLAGGVDGAADRLARRYAVEPEGQALGSVDWWVEDLRSGEDYARLAAYLDQLDVVRSWRPVEADHSRVRVEMDIGVGLRRLRHLLGIDGRLALVDLDTDTATADGLKLLH